MAPIYTINDEDRRFFLFLLEKRIIQSGFLLYAWALMPNHYHLVIRTSDYPLPAFMRLLNGQYAQYFRKRIATRGYLFQDRYKSIVTQYQRYVEELVRYVHLNPVRAGICSTLTILEKHPWCGHGALTGRQSFPFHTPPMCSNVSAQRLRNSALRTGNSWNRACRQVRHSNDKFL